MYITNIYAVISQESQMIQVSTNKIIFEIVTN